MISAYVGHGRNIAYFHIKGDGCQSVIGIYTPIIDVYMNSEYGMDHKRYTLFGLWYVQKIGEFEPFSSTLTITHPNFGFFRCLFSNAEDFASIYGCCGHIQESSACHLPIISSVGSFRVQKA
jgi:hypothetical protein